jgi:hypothetical protein
MSINAVIEVVKYAVWQNAELINISALCTDLTMTPTGSKHVV